MKYDLIKDSDLNVSCLGLGTWVLGGENWGGADSKESMDVISAAIDLGINLIDTAPIYGNGISEIILGEALKNKRDKVFIATKCGLIGSGKDVMHNLKPISIRKEIEESLKRLQTDYIDIYQCHWPDENTPIESTLEELCRLKEDGKIRYIGLSNYNKQQLQEACDYTDILTLESQYSILERSIEEEVLPYTLEKNLGVMAYGVLAGGILSGKYDSAPYLEKNDARSFFYKYYSGSHFTRTKNILEQMKTFGQPLNQIALNWVRQQQGISSVLVGCRTVDQVKENVQASAWDLSEDQLQKIRDLLFGNTDG